jgi:radical SAM protein with 4Fe4S-binding SPASM domain
MSDEKRKLKILAKKEADYFDRWSEDDGEEKCSRCKINPPEHGPCPYDEELTEGPHEDLEDCNCCSSCRGECACEI